MVVAQSPPRRRPPERGTSPADGAGPRWALRATAALSDAGGRIRVIAANTPVNLRHELGRMEHEWRTSGATAPRFAYEAPPDHGALRGVLDAIAGELDKGGPL